MTEFVGRFLDLRKHKLSVQIIGGSHSKLSYAADVSNQHKRMLGNFNAEAKAEKKRLTSFVEAMLYEVQVFGMSPGLRSVMR